MHPRSRRTLLTQQRLHHALADAGAIAQFYWLSESLETALARQAEHPMVARVRELGLEVTPGYASDLEQLYGPEWREKAARARTASTLAYQETLAAATPVELVAAAFILYGALVVGGGKQTQVKVRKVLPGCDHKLFDIADDMKAARMAFKNKFTAIGKEFPEHADALEALAARFMALNNGVVISISCVGGRVATGLGVAGAVAVAVGAAVWWSRCGR